MNFLNRLSPVALSLLRMVAGLLLAQRGLGKLFGWWGVSPSPLLSLPWFTGMLEALGGSLILLGLFTRPAAMLLAAEMLATYLLSHQPRAFWPIQNGGVVVLQFGLIFLHLAAAGAGAIALDSWRRKASSWEQWLEKLSSATLMVARIGAGCLFFQYGARKLFGWFDGNVVEFGSLRWVAGILEFFGGPLLALGAATRPLAFLLSGEMAVAFWISHFPRGTGFWPIQNGGEPSVLFCFLYLYFVTTGAGWLSLDRFLFRKSSAH